MSAAVAVLPVVPTDDPWSTPDVLAMRVAGSPLITHLAVRLDEAGLPVIVAVAGSARVVGSFSRVCHVDGGYGAALDAAVDHLPTGVEVVVVHDPHTPLTPADVIAAMAREARDGLPVVLTRDVAETVKTMIGGCVGQTVPRELLQSVHAPAAVPAAMLRELRAQDALSALESFVEFVALLRAGGEVICRPAGVLSQGVADESGLALLECAAQTASG